MRQHRRIQQILSILILCCFAVGFHSNDVLLSRAAFFNGTSDQKKSFLSIASTTLFSYTTKTEDLRPHFNNPYTLGSAVTSLLTSYRISELFLLNKIEDYLLFCKHIVTKLQRTNIIFPFHYFL